MAGRQGVSPKAALVAVATAFAVGVVASLALRPPTATSTHASDQAESATRERVRWRVALSINSKIPVAGSSMLAVVDDLRTISSGAIELSLFEPGELVPAFSVSEGVKEGKIEAGFTWVGYDQGRIPASTLISAVPFGMEPSEFIAWWYFGGGRELGEALYHEHNIQPVLCNIIGPETAGWFREPIETLADFQGLKIRFAGLGGKILQRAGASVTMMPGAEIFQALEKGAIDATEFSLPIVDQLLGFDRVAKYNYFPGWHQPFSSSHMLVNLDTWNSLQDETRRLLRVTCRAAVTASLAEAESLQGDVIRGFAGKGVSAETLSTEILEQLRAIGEQVLDEEAAKDAHFARILSSQRAFSETYGYWKRKGYLPRDF